MIKIELEEEEIKVLKIMLGNTSASKFESYKDFLVMLRVYEKLWDGERDDEG